MEKIIFGLTEILLDIMGVLCYNNSSIENNREEIFYERRESSN